MKTVRALCYRCMQKRAHRVRTDTGRLESTCRKCRIQANKLWRKKHPLDVKLRNTWSGVLERCMNRRHPKYRLYGGRGIRVCERWLGESGFAAFLEDVGTPPTLKHTLDRIDHDGNYEPSNVRWATVAEQNRNREVNRLITHEGKTLCLVDWGTELGIPWRRIQNRLNRGWPVERALAVDIPVDSETPF